MSVKGVGTLKAERQKKGKKRRTERLKSPEKELSKATFKDASKG
jgi:hypothetical protein